MAAEHHKEALCTQPTKPEQAGPVDWITILPLTRDDFSLLHRRLNAAHVRAWWWCGERATPEDIERKYGPRVDELEPTTLFLIRAAR